MELVEGVVCLEVNQKVRDVNAKRKKGFLRFDGKSSDDEILKQNPRYEVDFIVAPPRMKYYLDISTQIYNIYLKYISSQDIHVYSIDEVFIDADAIFKYVSFNTQRVRNENDFRYL